MRSGVLPSRLPMSSTEGPQLCEQVEFGQYQIHVRITDLPSQFGIPHILRVAMFVAQR
jgi:hypothetical protein